jgi:hypothetical protein
MIKINRNNLDQIALDHYNRITKKNGNSKTLIEMLEKYRKRRKGLRREMYTDLISDVTLVNNESLIIGKPEYLEERIIFYQNKYGSILSKDMKKELLKVFYYSKYNKWGAYFLANSLSMETCPYCNRQYTFTIGNDDKKGTRPQFDHFYSKSVYPFLALSFYNLIPSCYICNSNLKGKEEFNLNKNIHPYLDGYEDDVKFTIIPKDVSFSYGKADFYKIKFKLNSKKIIEYKRVRKIVNNYQTFRIKELYNRHKDYVDDIIIKSKIFTDDYVSQLYKQFNGIYFSNLKDLYKVLLDNYITTEEFEKRILSKLTKDIAEELNLLSF